MPAVTVMVHKHGLHPIEAIKAHYKHTEGGMSVDDIIAEGEITNLSGDPPGRKCVYSAIRRVERMSPSDLLPTTDYTRCGRKKALTDEQTKEIVKFVKQWRHKCFCTCHYIRNELGFDVSLLEGLVGQWYHIQTPWPCRLRVHQASECLACRFAGESFEI